MLYIIIFLFVICWIYIFVDLKKTPLHMYETGKYPTVKKTGPLVSIKIKELEEISDLEDPASINGIIKKKKLEVA